MAGQMGQAGRLRLTAAGHYLIFGFLYLIGMTAGIVLLASGTPFLSDFLRAAVKACFFGVLERSLQDIFLLLLLPVFGFQLLLYLGGMWAASPPFTLGLFALRGFAVGLLAAYLFTGYGRSGILCYLLLFFPFQFLGACVSFLGGKESLRLSKLLFCSLTEGVGEGRLQTVFRRYSMRMVCIAGLAGLLSLLQTLAVYLLAQLFL